MAPPTPEPRRYFEIDAETIVYAALDALRRDGHIDVSVQRKAMDDLGIVSDKINLMHIRNDKRAASLARCAAHRPCSGIAWGAITGKRLHDLLRCPYARVISSRISMTTSSAIPLK